MISRWCRLFLLAALFLPSPGVCGELLIIDADRQLEFADSLFSQTEYAQAAAEYRRFAHFFPDDPRIHRVRYRIGMALYHQDEFQSAVEQFLALVDGIDTSDPEGQKWRTKAFFGIKDCYLAMKAPGQALTALGNLLKLTDAPDIQDRVYYEMGWIYLRDHAWQAAGRAFSFIRPEARDTYAIDTLKAEIETLPDLPWVDPGTAGFLAVVPGFGYLYLERYYDALTAFLLNTALIVGAYTAFDNDNPALGALASAVGIGFYTGSIYGSIAAAHKQNRRIADRFVNRLEDSFRMDVSVAPDSSRTFLSISFTF